MCGSPRQLYRTRRDVGNYAERDGQAARLTHTSLHHKTRCAGVTGGPVSFHAS